MRRLVNLLGAAALGLGDAIRTAGTLRWPLGCETITATALITLLDLARGGSIRSVSRLIGISHSGTVRLVNRMVDDGLITREPGQDGRTLAVTLTQRGTSTAHRFRTGFGGGVGGELDGIAPRPRRTLAIITVVMVGRVTALLATRGAGFVGGGRCRRCPTRTTCGARRWPARHRHARNRQTAVRPKSSSTPFSRTMRRSSLSRKRSKNWLADNRRVWPYSSR